MQKAPPICPSNWSYFFSTRSIPSTRPRAERTSGVPHPPTPTSGCPLPLARRQLGTACSAYSEPADSSPSVAQALTRCVPQSPSSSLQPIFLSLLRKLWVDSSPSVCPACQIPASSPVQLLHPMTTQANPISGLNQESQKFHTKGQ